MAAKMAEKKKAKEEKARMLQRLEDDKRDRFGANYVA